MAGRLWTDGEVQYLRTRIKEDGAAKVAKALNRTYDSVINKAYAIGLKGLKHSQKRKNETNEWHRTKYWERRDQGLCGHCGKRWAEAGKSKCRICRLAAEKSMRRPGAKETLVEYKRNLKNERREKNLCINCGKPLSEAEIGVNTSCERCRKVTREYRNVSRLRMRIHGIKRKW